LLKLISIKALLVQKLEVFKGCAAYECLARRFSAFGTSATQSRTFAMSLLREAEAFGEDDCDV
jgi:hypothetical protein